MNNIKATIKSLKLGTAECKFTYHVPREMYADDEAYLMDVVDYVVYMVNNSGEVTDDFKVSSGDVISIDNVPNLKVLVLEDCSLVLEDSNCFVNW